MKLLRNFLTESVHSQAWFDEYLTTVLLVQNVSLGVGTLKLSKVSVEVKSVF